MATNESSVQESQSANQKPGAWKFVLTAGVGSAMIPLATLIHGFYQARIEETRKDRELQLAEKAQLIAQERAWLEIAVDAARPEALRNQVLRFLGMGEGRIARWAGEESRLLDKRIDSLRQALNAKESALKAEQSTASPRAPAKTQALANEVNSLKIRLGEPPLPPPVDEKGTCFCGQDIWQTLTFSGCQARCRDDGSGAGRWEGEMSRTPYSFGDSQSARSDLWTNRRGKDR